MAIQLQLTLIRVVIIDDDVATRIGLRVIMNAEPDIEVVGEGASAEEAYALISRLEPDIVLMDVQLPGDDGIAATERITLGPAEQGPRVVVLTTFDREDYAFRSLRAGASGFLLKRARAEDLTDAVRTVASGNALPAPDLNRTLIERFAVSSPERESAVQTLTDRERETLVLIASGHSNHEIAVELSISTDTVKSHVKHVFMKLDARDRSQAVIAAYESGLVVPHR
jgi:DNA-binding NarL/FixJ family response regulator